MAFKGITDEKEKITLTKAEKNAKYTPSTSLSSCYAAINTTPVINPVNPTITAAAIDFTLLDENKEKTKVKKSHCDFKHVKSTGNFNITVFVFRKFI